MADTRTLKLSLLADVNKFLAGMDKADKGTKNFSSSIGKYSKAMAKSFAIAGVAAGAYAVKLGVDGVKAAVEDELSQKKLATALKNTTKATDKQIAASEDYIKKQQLQFGIADTKLRPALANLARATGDITEAQKLNNLAIDISAATGRDLEGVSLALGKAYGGNFTALKKLGIPLDENIVKTKDFDGLTKQLTDTFGGSAKANTETFAGQLAILKERFGEIQEDIGAKLIPKLKTLLEQVVLVAKGFSGEDPQGLSNRARELAGEFKGNGANTLGGALSGLAASFGDLFAALSGDKAGEASTTLSDIAGGVQALANGITALANAYGKLSTFTKSSGYQKALDLVFGTKDGKFGSVLNPFGKNFLGAGNLVDSLGGSRAAGGSVMGGGAYRVGEFGPEMFVPSGSGSIRSAAGAGGNVVININGAVDANGTRRQLEQLFKTSSRQMGLVNLNGARL
jgi:hypothetical protein